MPEIPEFQLYGAGDSQIEERLQPKLALRNWRELNRGEYETFLRELFNRDWIGAFLAVAGQKAMNLLNLSNHILN